ncbi:MAG: hypothetical protein JW810_09550 [Sedimentisphaerales bacterium]|nr:hypothetical protein [Sedimentisphaerales bacterium]
MSIRPGKMTVFLSAGIGLILLLQVLAMIQSDRLYERINRLEDSPSRLSPVESRPAGQPASGSAGREGDWLIWAFGGEPATLLCLSAEADAYTRWITLTDIFETLLEEDFEGAGLVPLLAGSYAVSPDAREITFYLRDDIRFSDGVPVTAADVLFTYRTILDPGLDLAAQRHRLGNVKELVKLDDRTVRFVFHQPHWQSLQIAGSLPVLPRHVYQFDDPAEFRRNRQPVGSGPYVFESWDAGRQIVLGRNERYWGPKPPLRKRVYRFITNKAAALQALRAHQVDLIIPTPQQYVELADDPAFQREFYTLSYWNRGAPSYVLAWNQGQALLRDRDVRRALTHLLDREGIVRHLLQGRGRMITGPFYRYGSGYDDSIEPWPYDPDQAGRLLERAGWTDSDQDGIRDRDGVAFQFSLSYPAGNVIFEQIAKLYRDQAAAAGLRIDADPLEWSLFNGRLRQRSYQAALLGVGGEDRDDPFCYWHSSQAEGAGGNFTGFSSGPADALIEQIRVCLDPDRREGLFQELHRLLHEEQPCTFLFTRPSLRFVDRRFENVRVHPLGLRPLEWYVPAAVQRYH